MNLLILILFVLKFTEITCVSYCENLKSCGECIRSTRDNCVWCSAEDHEGNRCNSKDLIDTDWCKTRIYDPQSEMKVVDDVEWSNGENDTKIVQVKPQFVRIKARPGVPVNITMSYKPAQDIKLDVYYLIDASNAANTYRENLDQQSQNIYTTLTELTNQVILGIGSFVDKPALPFSDPSVMKTYSYKNNLPLTNNMTNFELALKSRMESSNYGERRAVLDGLMQAMVCKDKIGWREHSRRIIVVFTDGLYHSAGDGKFAGTLQPNDMKCHIDDNIDTVLDYPSVSQINKVAKDNGFIIIFAIPDAVKKDYEILSQNINGAKYVLVDKDVDVAKMVAKEYLDVIENVKFTQNPSPYIEIKTKKVCADCKATFYQPVDIVATLKVASCPQSHRTETVKIGPTSLNEDLTVEVEFQCECDCENGGNPQPNSEKCNSVGTYQCGICICDPNRYGHDCQCEGDSLKIEDYNKCKQYSNETLYCNGRGSCRCGQCECYEGFFGQFCEIYDKTCLSPGGVLCSGNGRCTMGECVCKPNWSGDDCGRSTDERKCIAPYSHEACSGNGECINGKCVCTPKEKSEDTCRGRYCDDCQAFATKRCEELQEYAYCLYLNKTVCIDKMKNETMNTNWIFVNKSEINSPNRDWYLANWCRMNQDDSIFVYKYYYVTDAKADKTILQLVIQKELEKSQPVNIFVAVGSSLGGILLVGILSLLLWKCLTDLYDRREYAQFMDKAVNAGYDVTINPNYEPAVVYYANPAHNMDYN